MRHETLHQRTGSHSDSVLGRVVTGGVLGGLPGLLLIAVPVVLAALDLITADQSQIGFLGVPLMVLGIFIGIVLGAGGRECSGAVIGGVGAGLVLGVIVGGVLAANGVLPGLWLVVVAAGMIGGGAVGALRSGRSHTS
jgi:hypothetical protein